MEAIAEIKIQEGMANASFAIDERLDANATPQLKVFAGGFCDKETRTHQTVQNMRRLFR